MFDSVAPTEVPLFRLNRAWVCHSVTPTEMPVFRIELLRKENELIFVDEMDSLWGDINTMVDISTLVTSSIFKGFVKDVEQEIVQQLASKDEEIMPTNQRLLQLGNGLKFA